MSIRPKSLLAALALCLTATGLLTGAAHTRTTQAVDLPGLVAQAKERAHWEHPGADFYGAEAEFDSPIMDPRGVKRWALNFFPARDEHDDEDRTGFSYVYTVDGEFVEEREWEWRFGIEVVEEFDLDQFEAHSIAQKAATGGRSPSCTSRNRWCRGRSRRTTSASRTRPWAWARTRARCSPTCSPADSGLRPAPVLPVPGAAASPGGVIAFPGPDALASPAADFGE